MRPCARSWACTLPSPLSTLACTMPHALERTSRNMVHIFVAFKDWDTLDTTVHPVLARTLLPQSLLRLGHGGGNTLCTV